MDLDVQTHKSVLILAPVQGPIKLVALNAQEFTTAANSAIGDSLQVVIDMGRIEYVDSKGLSALINLERNLRRRGGDLLLAGLQASLWDLFQKSRLYRLFDIYESPAEAVNSLVTLEGRSWSSQ